MLLSFKMYSVFIYSCTHTHIKSFFCRIWQFIHYVGNSYSDSEVTFRCMQISIITTSLCACSCLLLNNLSHGLATLVGLIMCDQHKWSMWKFTPLSMWKSAWGRALFTVRVELSDSLTLQEPWLAAHWNQRKIPRHGSQLHSALPEVEKGSKAGAEIETNPTGIFKFATPEIFYFPSVYHTYCMNLQFSYNSSFC